VDVTVSGGLCRRLFFKQEEFLGQSENVRLQLFQLLETVSKGTHLNSVNGNERLSELRNSVGEEQRHDEPHVVIETQRDKDFLRCEGVSSQDVCQ